MWPAFDDRESSEIDFSTRGEFDDLLASPVALELRRCFQQRLEFPQFGNRIENAAGWRGLTQCRKLFRDSREARFIITAQCLLHAAV